MEQPITDPLKNCPFCNSDNLDFRFKFTQYDNVLSNTDYILCKDCKCEGPLKFCESPEIKDRYELARKAWNDRK